MQSLTVSEFQQRTGKKTTFLLALRGHAATPRLSQPIRSCFAVAPISHHGKQFRHPLSFGIHPISSRETLK